MAVKAYKNVEQLKREIEVIEGKVDASNNSIAYNKNLDKEIKSGLSNIEKRIKETRRRNRRKTIIKNIKIFGRGIQRILPYSLAVIVPFLAFSKFVDVPFYPQKVKQARTDTHYLDNRGMNDITSEYKQYKSDDYVYMDISVYSPWKLEKDGVYHRTVKSYDKTKKLTVEEIEEILSNPDFDLKKDFGLGFLTFPHREEETSVYIPPEEEDNNEEYVKVRIRTLDKEDTIMVTQSMFDNLGLGVVFTFLVIFICFGILVWRDNYSNFYYEDMVRKLKKRYKITDVSEFEKIFKKGKIQIESSYHPKGRR